MYQCFINSLTSKCRWWWLQVVVVSSLMHRNTSMSSAARCGTKVWTNANCIDGFDRSHSPRLKESFLMFPMSCFRLRQQQQGWSERNNSIVGWKADDTGFFFVFSGNGKVRMRTRDHGAVGCWNRMCASPRLCRWIFYGGKTKTDADETN